MLLNSKLSLAQLWDMKSIKQQAIIIIIHFSFKHICYFW